MISEVIRQKIFWLVDSCKHSPVKKRMQYFQELKANSKTNDEGLAELLEHAITTVPYYKENFPNAKSIAEFPVVSKNVYRSDYNSFRSEKYLDDTQLHKIFTSGSTGIPFQACQDKEKLYNHKAGLILLNDEIGWKLGARYMFIRSWGTHPSGKIKNLATNVVPIEASSLSDEKVAAVCKIIAKDKNLKLILGYASSLEIISEYAIKHGYKASDFGIDLIISDSECLKPDVKKKINVAFECPVLDRYANNENGIIAITDDKTGHFYVNHMEYYVELLKLDADTPAEIGELGRIVITDIYNKAFPFIRYDTGDLGIAYEKHGEQVLTLSQIVGRAADSLTDLDGNVVGETIATAVFKDYMALRRYQIIQKEDMYVFRIEKPFSGQEEEILCRMKKLFGENAKVTIEYSDKIPCEKNGKFKTLLKE